MRRLALVLVLSAGLAGCGAKQTAPTETGLPAPTNFKITNQKVNFLSNEVSVSWSGNAPSYRVTAGTTNGSANVLTVEVAGTSYTWVAPREASFYYIRVQAVNGSEVSVPAQELPVYTMDLRNAIDALYFDTGPMSQSPTAAPGNPSAGVWADGTILKITVSNESGTLARDNAQIFSADYAGIVGGVITATVETTSADFKTVALGDVPLFNIYMRVLNGFCGTTGIIACAYYGPSPIGPNRSIVTMNAPTGGTSIAHEVGHAYGLHHVVVGSSVRPELNFLMNPILINTQMSEPEKNAIATARSVGLRAGTTRNQAQAMGLVLPYPWTTPSGPTRGR